MDEAVGTIFIFAIAGIIFGDEIGREVSGWMLLGALMLAIIISPAVAIALVFAPLAMVIIIAGGLIAFIKSLELITINICQTRALIGAHESPVSVLFNTLHE